MNDHVGVFLHQLMEGKKEKAIARLRREICVEILLCLILKEER
jgi:hypothetical protein